MMKWNHKITLQIEQQWIQKRTGTQLTVMDFIDQVEHLVRKGGGYGRLSLTA